MALKTAARDTRWHLKEDPHQTVFENIESISRRTSIRREMDLYHACLYDDFELASLGTTSWEETEYDPSRLAFNVVRQAVDTLAAKIAKNQPLPTPITSGGTWKEKRRAKSFGKAIEGQFDLSGVWRLSPTIARDSGLFGTGISHNYRIGKTVYHERVFPWEIVLDPREAIYGKPRNMYMKRWVDRFVLVERFPEFEKEILCAESPRSDSLDLGYDETADLVLVAESWHLPSGLLEDSDKEKDHDGRHAICVSNCTMLKEEWRKQYFPFSVLRMSDPVAGWFGTGLAKQLTGLQYTINDTASVVQEAHALSGGYILKEKGSDFETDKLDNGRGLVLEWAGSKPEWINPSPVHPDTMNFVLTLIPKAFEMTGVSQLSAQSQKPAGIESALALNTFNDIETERFALFAKQYEEYHIDIAWQQFDLMEEIQKEFGSLKIRVASRERGQWSLPELDFKEVRLDRESFVLKVFPTSLLSKKPASRIQEVENLANAGWIAPEDAKMLLDFPDLERVTDLDQAARRIIENAIEKMLDAEDPNDPDAYTYPEPTFNLELCIKLGVSMYLDAKLGGAEEENLNLVLNFISDAQAQMTKASGGAPPAGGAPPPEGGPMPPEGAPMPPEGAMPPEGMPPDAMAMAPPPAEGMPPPMPPPEGGVPPVPPPPLPVA